MSHSVLAFVKHPVETLHSIQTESYDISLSSCSLLLMPLLETDIINPATGVPSVYSSKLMDSTGESGKKHSTSTRSVMIPGYFVSLLLGVHELLII